MNDSETHSIPDDDPIERVIVLLDDIETTLAEVREIAREMKEGDTGDCPRIDPGADGQPHASAAGSSA